MFLTNASHFGPRSTCPEQGLLTAFHADKLSHLLRERVGSHVQVCDFCGAASQLLTRLPSEAAAQDAVELPLSLRLLAQILLSPDNRAGGERPRNVA